MTNLSLIQALNHSLWQDTEFTPSLQVSEVAISMIKASGVEVLTNVTIAIFSFCSAGHFPHKSQKLLLLYAEIFNL